MKNILIVIGCVTVLLVTADQAQAACTADQLKKLRDAKFSLEEIRSMCGIGQEKPSTPSTIEPSKPPKPVGPSKVEGCREDEKDINKRHQECVQRVQKDIREDENECREDYKDCMQDAQPGDRASWTATCRREQSECLSDAKKNLEDSTRECKQEYEKDMSQYACR